MVGKHLLLVVFVALLGRSARADVPPVPAPENTPVSETTTTPVTPPTPTTTTMVPEAAMAPNSSPPAASSDGKPERCSLAVLEFELGGGIESELAVSWTDALVQEAQSLSGCLVLSRADIRAIISLEAEKALLGCDEESCLAELGEALGVTHLVTGRISRIQTSTLLSLRQTNLKTMAVEARATDAFDGDDDEVFPFVSWLSRKLFSTDPKVIGEKPIARPRKDGTQLVERRGTIWSGLAWTGVWTSAAAAATFAAAAGTTAYLSSQAQTLKSAPITASTETQLASGEKLGPAAASIANASLYVFGTLAVATTVLFFLPQDNYVKVTVAEIH